MHAKERDVKASFGKVNEDMTLVQRAIVEMSEDMDKCKADIRKLQLENGRLKAQLKKKK